MSAINIIKLQSENILQLNVNEFAKIISQNDLCDRSLSIISIAGAMRRGKSFLLNFFLTYAYNKYPTTKTIEKPSTFEHSSLIDGFSHRGGSERHTTGIQVWPDIFLHEDENGKKIAILLMDTQGTFDNETNFSDCVCIFALSILLSSVQIYNITRNIRNDHLQYLALFSRYAKWVANKISPIEEAAFETLQILVRDCIASETDYGFEGGQKHMNKIFSSNNPEVQKTVIEIKKNFKTIECFLMPFPGDGIATAQKFNGTIEINKDFRERAESLCEHLLKPEHLKIKFINGTELKGSNFENLIKRSFDILYSFEGIPKPKTIVSATADLHNFKMIDDAVDLYKKLMTDQLIRSEYLKNEEILNLHGEFSTKALEYYKNADKFQLSDEISDEQWRVHLDDLLSHEYNLFLISNEKKQPNNSAELQELIDIIMKQKDFNNKQAQEVLNLINTFREKKNENVQTIVELTEKFKASPEEGWNFMNVIKKTVAIVPSVVLTLGKSVPYGAAIGVVCLAMQNVLGK